MRRSSARLGETVAGKYALRLVLSEEPGTWVYQAEHLGLEKLVELRILPSSVPTESPDAARILREARIAGIVSHSSLRSILDTGSDDGDRPFIVYEPQMGHLLSDLLDRAQDGFDAERAVRLAFDVLEALRALHACGVAHRYLDPNVVAVSQTASGVELAKVVRLDEAQFLHEPADWLGANTRRLWPGFSAPEMRRGDAPVDRRTDVYGLAMLLRAMLRGGGESRGVVPAALDAVLRVATSANPEERYQDVGELRTAIEAAMRMTAPSADVPEFFSPTLPAAPDPLHTDLKELRVRRDSLLKELEPAPAFAPFDRLTALLAIEAIYRQFGPEQWERLAVRVSEVDTLLPGPGESEAELRQRAVPIPLVARVLGAADAMAGSGDLIFAADIGDAVARRGLRRILSTLPDPIEPDTFIRHVAPIWKRIMPQADVAIVDRTTMGFRLSIRRQPRPTLEICAFMAGLLRGALRANGSPKATVHTTACEALGDAACLFSVHSGDLEIQRAR